MAGLCVDCDACCRVFEVKDEKNNLDKAFGEPCKYLNKTVLGPGCSIYSHRPDACFHYVCLWLEAARNENHVAPEALRPNVCGVVMGWPWGIDRETLHVYPVPGHSTYPDGWRVPPVSTHLRSILASGGKVMVFIEGKRIAIRGDMAVIGTEEEFDSLNS